MDKTGQPKKILFIVTQGNFGGAQKYVFDLATRLQPKYQVLATSGSEGIELSKRLTEVGVKYESIRSLKRSINPIDDLRALLQTYKLIKHFRPDIVHLNSSKAGVIGSIAAKLARVPKIIFTVHGLVLEETLSWPKKTLYWLAEKISFIFTDIFITVSKAGRESIFENKLANPNHVHIVPVGIDLDNLVFLSKEEAREKLKKITNKNLTNNVIVGTIADHYPAKGLNHLIAAGVILHAIKPSLKIIIIGRPGPASKELEEKIAKEAAKDFILLATNLSDAAVYLKAFDYFVLASLKEGMPYTILEAAAAGLPIIATRVGGIPDIIEGQVPGLFIPPGNPEALSKAIADLLDNPSQAQKFGEQAKTAVQRFSLEKMVEETKKIYEMST